MGAEGRWGVAWVRAGCLAAVWLLAGGLGMLAGGAAAAGAGGARAVHTVCLEGPPACDYHSIQEAVDAAGEGDLIQVAEGVYGGVEARPAPPGYHGPAVITQALYVDKSVTIRGGYGGTSRFSAPPDPRAHPTIVDAGGQGRALVLTGPGQPAVEGLWLTGGDAGGQGGDPFGEDAGGGAFVLSTTATISGSTVSGNAARRGAGLALIRSGATVRASVVTGNQAGSDGGGLYLWFSPATIAATRIEANTAVTYAGGVDLIGSLVTVEDSTVQGNAARYCAGMHLDTSDGTLRGNAVLSNTAMVGGGMCGMYLGWVNPSNIVSNTIAYNRAVVGGGLYLVYALSTFSGNAIENNEAVRGAGLDGFSSDAVFRHNRFRANRAEGDGGGLRLEYSRPELDGNLFIGNSALRGGGLYLEAGGADLTNDVLAGNQAGIGGALYAAGASPRLVHTTLADNQGEGGALAVDCLDGACGTAQLTNTILVSHTLGITVAAGCHASLEATLWGNQTDWAGAGTVSPGTVSLWGDPAFAAPGEGDYHLQTESAAVDAGPDAGVDDDLDGEPRPQASGFDLGADEAPAIGRAHVATIRLRWRELVGDRFAVQAAVRAVDVLHRPVEGATVQAEWTLPDGSTAAAWGTTQAAGTARLRLKSAQAGTHRLCVTGIVLVGWEYDPGANEETCDEVAVP